MKPLQDRAKAERRRLKRQAEREGHERSNREWHQRRLGELVNSMLEEDAERERLDAEGRAAYRSTYRPDETELFQDRKEEGYWNESHREFEER